MAEVKRSQAGADTFTMLLSYMFGVVDAMNLDDLRAKLRELESLCDGEETTMTIAEMFEERGRARGIEEGHARGHAEGRAEARIATLRGLLLLKFKTLNAAHEACLRTAAPEAIDRYLERVLFADSLAAVFEDV